MMMFSNDSKPILSLYQLIKTVKFNGLDLQPSYQRAFIWKNDFKDKLIYSIIKSYPIGNLTIRQNNETNEKGAKSEVVDGQQRLTTIYNFKDDKYTIFGTWAENIIEIIKEYYHNDFDNGELLEFLNKVNKKIKKSIKYSLLPETIRRNFDSYSIALINISNASDFEIREYFRFLQNQERLRAGEIINSMPPTTLERYLEKIIDKEKFLQNINFDDSRREFDKIFYSIIGILDNKINLGATDIQIQEYARKTKEVEQANEAINLMVCQINTITNLLKIQFRDTKKRFLKFLLLLSALGYVDFSIDIGKKMNRLKDLDDKMSAFFSVKERSVEKIFKGYSNEVIGELRCVAELTKGSHPLDRVKRRIKILSYYVNNENKTVESGYEQG